MTIRRKITILLVLVSCLALGGVALAASSTNYDLPFSADSGGGDERTSTSYQLIDTAGQSSAIGVSNSTNYQVSAGYIAMIQSVYTEPEPPPIGGGTVELPTVTESNNTPWAIIAGGMAGVIILGLLGIWVLKRKRTQNVEVRI